MERLRCNGCGQLFTAEGPAEVGPEKYDATAAAMIAQLPDGSGVPLQRLERLEENLGIPLPAATQWEVVEEAAELLRPAYDQLIWQAAQGEVPHHDDTGMRILRLAREPSDERTGIFTSGMVSTGADWKIALYFSGSKHAGENLRDVLQHRAAGWSAPIQMCDALSRHSPKLSAGVRILPAYCLAHGRRQLVEGAANFPEGCRQLFWREPRAPLDNNVVERALKKAILHRKNSLFYKTLQGAQGGDLYMSLIPTCELNGANPLDYLTELQRHSAELSVSPAQWMPWNYRDTLAPMATAA